MASAALPIMRRELQSSSSAVARDAGTRRTILVSTAFLLKDSILPALVVGRLVLGDVVADAFAMERAITGSGLDWTIVRPGLRMSLPQEGIARGRAICLDSASRFLVQIWPMRDPIR